MGTDVKSLMAGYAAKRGISVSEISELKTKVGKVDATELKALRKARVTYADKFSTDSQVAMGRYVNKLGLSGGRVVQKFNDFEKQWKIDQDASFRARWGISDRGDARAPTFTKKVAASTVPAAIREDFIKGANRERIAEAKGGWSELWSEKASVTTAERIYSLAGQPVGYSLTWSSEKTGFWKSTYYKNDGSFAGGDRYFPAD